MVLAPASLTRTQQASRILATKAGRETPTPGFSPYRRRGVILTWVCQRCGWANDNNDGPCRKCGAPR